MSDDLVKRLQLPFPEDRDATVFLPVWVLELIDEAATRIEQLEAQVRAADALADALDRIVDAYGCDCAADVQMALAAYRATKEGGA